MTDGNASQFVIYQSDDGQIKLDVRFVDETVWLTQQQLAELFQTSRTNVVEHIQHIYEEGELDAAATCREFRQVRTEGARKVARNMAFYNLDMTLSVGYRVKSAVATRFRIYATSVDYDPTQAESISFFQTVQNKMHWAITGQTAAEIIHTRADKNQPHMGLTNWRGGKVRKADVSIAKNYLNADELAALNNLVEQYLVFAEGQAMRRVPMVMNDWITKLHGFLTINDRDILSHAGKISHEVAKAFAELEYVNFNKTQIAVADQLESDFDRTVKLLPKQAKQKKKP